jgi:hypothetical protein
MKTFINWVIGIAIIWFIFSFIGSFGKYEGLSAEEWFNRYDEADARVINLQDALEQANSNIEDAKYYSGESYEDMEYALDSLETVEEP